MPIPDWNNPKLGANACASSLCRVEKSLRLTAPTPTRPAVKEQPTSPNPPSASRGLLDTLQQVLWPTYDWKKIKKEAKRKRKRSLTCVQSTLRATSLNLSRARSSKRSGGRFFGRTIDQQLNALINGGKFPARVSLPRPYTARELRANSQLADTLHLKASLVELEQIHPWTWRVLRFMHARGYKPVRAQVWVSCPKLRVRTAIDSLWQHTTSQRLLLLELKCWGEKTSFESSAFLQAPFKHRLNHAHNQHQLQLLMSTFLFHTTFPNRTLAQSWVLQISHHKTQKFPLENWAMKGLKALLLTLRPDPETPDSPVKPKRARKRAKLR